MADPHAGTAVADKLAAAAYLGSDEVDPLNGLGLFAAPFGGLMAASLARCVLNGRSFGYYLT